MNAIWGALFVRHRCSLPFSLPRPTSIRCKERPTGLRPCRKGTSRTSRQGRGVAHGGRKSGPGWSRRERTRQLQGLHYVAVMSAACVLDCGLVGPGLCVLDAGTRETASYYIQKAAQVLSRPPVCRAAWLVSVVCPFLFRVTQTSFAQLSCPPQVPFVDAVLNLSIT